ncbi:4-hydroxybenzoate polyprenyltransferase [Nonomuraea fuscirosea]|uniref:4-hydroxybenzoate polyprenyltransferase n=1 Tax=Nonomuraea fuscirosea TaxID=1291556 RepID=A0A2T0N807_9ACTN|nr:UbiA family prenyltransferase [Nonomuraea fuscirosea]PRX68670.1 4-hydroxybenzoate polyprenyltransferase [Nonomuraea fuscirosea]
MIRLVRPITVVGVALEVILGGHLSGVHIPVSSLTMPALGTGALLGFANTFNDIMDVDADRRGNRNRPISREGVTRIQATFVAFLLVAGGVVLLSLSVSMLSLAVALLLSVISILYSIVFKGVMLLGNLICASLCAAPILFGSLVAGYVSPRAVISFSLITMFLLSYEILKSMRDRDADEWTGSQTLAVVCPISTVKYLYVTGITVSVIIALVIFGFASDPFLYLGLILAGVAAPSLLSVSIVYRRHRPTLLEISQAVLLMKMPWLPAIYAFSLLVHPYYW